jgi:phosphatidylglycerol:prolipoprotein diacylglycerol transferase
MYPIFFRIGPITVYSYGLMLALAFIISTYLARRHALRQNFPQEIIFDLASYILVSGIIGARLFYVIINFAEYKSRPFEILMLQRGGLSFYGGALGAFLASIWFVRRRRISFYKIADLISPFVALGQAVGRLGCLLRGCCFGAVINRGLRIKFPDEVVYRHPTQIYAAIIDLLIFLWLGRLSREKHFAGKIFLSYLIFYSLKRFFMDFLRADVQPLYLKLTIFQIFSLLVFALSYIIFFYKRTKNLPDG